MTAILSLFPATEFMVASQRGGRISHRFPSPHPKAKAGPWKCPVRRTGCSLRRPQPPPPPTGSLSYKTPSVLEKTLGAGVFSRSVLPHCLRSHSLTTLAFTETATSRVRAFPPSGSLARSPRRVRRSIRGGFREVRAGAALALAEALSASATAATCFLHQGL